MDSAIDGIYRALRGGLHWVVGYGAATVMLGTTCLAILEIIRRYMLGVVYVWGQDAVTYFMVGAIFLFFAVTQARRSHLAMTAAVDVLRERGYTRLILAIRVIVTSVSLALFGAFTWWGIVAVEQSLSRGRVTMSMVLYIWPFHLCLTLGFALMAIVTLFHLYQDVQALRGKTVFPWAPVEEGLDI